MISKNEIVQKLKKLSWDSRTAFLAKNPDVKFLNAYSIYDAMTKPKDWLAIAQKCSENPNHQHFGVPAEEIQKIWNTKKEIKGNEGDSLDDYIELVLSEKDLPKLLTFKQNNIDRENFSLVQKTISFDKLNNDLLKKLTYINSEIWLTSDVGINLRCDAMFSILDKENSKAHAVIAEWKSLDNIELSNHWNKLEGPLSGLDDCDATKFTLQTHLYKYVVERYGIFDNVITSLYNFNIHTYQKIEPTFPYSMKLIEEIIMYAKTKQLEKIELEKNKSIEES